MNSVGSPLFILKRISWYRSPCRNPSLSFLSVAENKHVFPATSFILTRERPPLKHTRLIPVHFAWDTHLPVTASTKNSLPNVPVM